MYFQLQTLFSFWLTKPFLSFPEVTIYPRDYIVAMDKRNTPWHTGTLPFEVVTEHSQYQSDMESGWTLVYSELAYCTGLFSLLKHVFLFTYFMFIGQGTNCTHVNHTQRSHCGFSLKYFIYLQHLDMAFVYTSGSHGDDYAPLCGLPHIMPLHVRSYSSIHNECNIWDDIWEAATSQ